MSDAPDSTPTARDLANAALRQEISARQQQEWNQVHAWAKSIFGLGWLPSHRHMLIAKDEEARSRATGERAVPSATVYTVKNSVGSKRHFTVNAEGRATEVASMEAGFGEMLLAPDLERTIEIRGQRVHPHKYSLCFAPYELYVPKSADALAALRVSRERGKAEREERKFREENPLLGWADENAEPKGGKGR